MGEVCCLKSLSELIYCMPTETVTSPPRLWHFPHLPSGRRWAPPLQRPRTCLTILLPQSTCAGNFPDSTLGWAWASLIILLPAVTPWPRSRRTRSWQLFLAQIWLGRDTGGYLLPTGLGEAGAIVTVVGFDHRWGCCWSRVESQAEFLIQALETFVTSKCDIFSIPSEDLEGDGVPGRVWTSKYLTSCRWWWWWRWWW